MRTCIGCTELSSRTYNTYVKLRSEVAMSAVMGYEFDLSKLTDDECYDISEQIKQNKRIRSIVCFGDLYRLIIPFENRSASWMYVSAG